MLKTLALSLLTACTAAIFLTVKADQRGFEELTERAVIAEQASSPGAKCSLSRDYIDKAEIGPLLICLSHGLAAYEAAQR
jgi:hypothetical protein